MKKLQEALNWRYAVKKFDTAKKIATNDFEQLKEAVKLTPSSYGLQPYKVLVIEDADLRAKLRAACWGQAQIVDASHLLIFASLKDIGEKEVAAYLAHKAELSGIDVSALKGYQDFMVMKIGEKSVQERATWNAKQAYIAVGNLLTSAALMAIDACPMEGFQADQVDEILGLDEQGLSAAVVVALGYRSEEDDTQHAPKVRKSTDDFFEVR